jgi:prolyl 4-hydroxylase
VYKEGAVLLPHIDRLPLICSAIINVAQSVEEPWPLEVYDRQGKAVNITLSPGDMVLYESHSLIHGRPFPLVGSYYANIFIHFEPVHSEVFPPPYFVSGTDPSLIDLYYTQEIKGNEVAREDYLDDWSDNEEDWEPAHHAAYKGDVEALRAYLHESEINVDDRDDDGWTLLAYAAHSGHMEAVRFLIESGANVGAFVVDEDGEGEKITAQEIANYNWGDDSEVVKYLSSITETCDGQ